MSGVNTTAQKLKSVAVEGSGSWDTTRQYGYDTLMVHAGVQPDPVTGAILTPIYQSTTFVQESIAKYCARGYSYTRSANPTVKALDEKIAALEGAYGSATFGTGMAATCTIISTFMSAGDHAIISDCSYGGTNRACRVFFTRMGMTFDFVDFRDPKNVEAAIKPNTKMVLSESPANPNTNMVDLQALSDICKPRGIIHVCDNTYLTPYILKPLAFGCDVVLTSTTKFYDGHNMTVGGAVSVTTKEHLERIQLTQNILGNIMSPQVAFYQLQTLKTMGLRVEKQSANALAIAKFLETHPNVDHVRYPGLDSHPQRALAKKQHRNDVNGAMLYFEVKGGSDAGRKLMDTVAKPWSLCENLGASESIITCCAVMTHANMLREDRLKVGITDGLVRVSCGLEDADDLIAALKSALDNL